MDAHPPASHDPRIYVDLPQLLGLAGAARGISLLPRQPARSVLNGRHASRLRGRGLNFEELRRYTQGDDIRTIDWKVTARTGTPHVRVYTEERDRPTLIIVDQRMSMFFGSRVYMKSVVAAEAAAIVAQRVLKQGDRIGGMVLSDQAISEHRPVRSPAALHRFLTSVATANQMLHATAFPAATAPMAPLLEQALRIAKTNFLVMVFSDFDGLSAECESLLRSIALHNDLVLFNVADPLASELPRALTLTLSDGDQQAELETRATRERQQVQQMLQGRLDNLRDWSSRYGFPIVPLTTDRPALDQLLVQFGHGRPRNGF